MRHRRENRESEEVRDAAARMMRALVRRAGDGDEQAVEALAQLAAHADDYLRDAVLAFRAWQPAGHAPSPSWRDVGNLLGVTRATAQQRFGRQEQDT